MILDRLLGAVVTGRTPPTEQPAYFGSDFPFVTPGDMRQGKYTRVTERGLSNSGAELLARIKVPANSICVSCIGWQMGETVMTASESFTNQQINTIIPGTIVDPSFLYYSMRLRKRELLSIGSGTGVRTPILKKSAFCDLKVYLPDLSHQRRIASVLSAYDDLIEVNRRRVAILEEMARRLFEEWFVHLRFPGHETVPVYDTPDGPLPKGWRFGALSDLASVKTGTITPSHKPDELLSHYSYPAFDQGALPSIDRAETVLSNKLLIKPPVLLIGKLNPKHLKVWPVLSPTQFRQVASTEFVPLSPRVGLGLGVLFGYTSSTAFSTRLCSFASGTSTSHQRIRPEAMLASPVLIPPPNLLLLAEQHLTPILTAIGNLRSANAYLAAARDLLLPRLISGELSVAEGSAPERFLEAAD